jgi:hypothetical protein
MVTPVAVSPRLPPPRAATPPTVVRMRRSGGRVTQDCDVYIGRACFRGGWELPESKWHNPFSVASCGAGGVELAVQKFEHYIRGRPDLLAALPELAGRRLGCWCAPGPCHGDVLVRLCRERLGK